MSDDDLDAVSSSPPPRSIIDDTKNVLPSQIKAVAVKIIQMKPKILTRIYTNLIHSILFNSMLIVTAMCRFAI